MRLLLLCFFLLAIPSAAMAELPITPGLELHFDSSNIDSVGNTTLLDGQTVSTWKDLSGHGLHLDQSCGTPLYIQPGPGFGGLPVVAFQPGDFNGADYLSRKAAPVSAYPFTVFAVVRSTTSKNAVIFSFTDSTSKDRMAGIRFVSEGSGQPGRLSLFRRNPAWMETSTKRAFNDNRFHVVAAHFLKADLAQLFVDGNLEASSTVRVSLPSFDRFDIGNTGRSSGTTDPYEGQIAEIAVYSGGMTDQSREQMEQYLSRKWITGKPGIAVSQETIDFGSIGVNDHQKRTIILTNNGIAGKPIEIRKIDAGTTGDFKLEAYLNDQWLNLQDPKCLPVSLTREKGDRLKLVVETCPNSGKTLYQDSLRILSSAENRPELELALTAKLGSRTGVSDYESHTVSGNLIRFDLKGGAAVKVTMNTDSMARIQYAPDGVFRSDDLPDYFMVQKFDWPQVDYSIRDHGSYLGIHTAGMTVRVQKSPFRLQMYDAGNTNLISKDADEEGMYSEQDQRGVTRVENGTGNPRLGFGSGDHGHSSPLNKNAGYDQFSMTHGRTCVPFFMSTAGYGVFLNTVEKSTRFDSRGGFQTAHFLDYWFMAGDFRKVLGLYSELTGRMNLFPKWAYGFMLSKYGNDNATQAEFLKWIHRLREEGYPIDSYVFDFGWRGGKFNSHQWDSSRFPDLPAMFAESKRLGFHVGLHNNKGTPEANDGNLNDPAAAEKWWQAHWSNVIQPGYGDWFWPDEFDVSGDNLMPNRAAKIVHERWLQATTAQRPMFFTRGGFAGHHFASTWSGDIPNSVEEMSEQITGALALGVSGYPWSSNDLGGFFAKPSDELYIRWVTQLGAFSSIMRAHGHDGREPWLYSPRAQENLHRYLKIRYQLFPYIYTTAWQGTSQGLPMMRAMALEHPGEPQAWLQEKQYYFGDWLLVAPALSTTTARVPVWLPKGRWFDFFNPDTSYEGGRTIQVTATLDQIPVFVKEGAIIPTGPSISHADASPLDPLTLDLYPGSKPTSYSLYEDDGITRNYQIEKAYSLTEFKADRSREDNLRFTRKATFKGNPSLYSPAQPRAMIVRANRWGHKPRLVMLNDQPLPEARSESDLSSSKASWFWSSSAHQLMIRFIDDGTESKLFAGDSADDSCCDSTSSSSTTQGP